MPVPIASWKDWHKDCTIDAGNMVIDNPRHRELLLALPGLTVDPQEAAPVTLSRLVTSHPTLGLGLGMDGHVTVYFLTKVDCNAREGWIIAVGTKDNKLQGIARLDERKNFSFRRHYRPTEISKYLTKATCNYLHILFLHPRTAHNSLFGQYVPQHMHVTVLLYILQMPSAWLCGILRFFVEIKIK